MLKNQGNLQLKKQLDEIIGIEPDEQLEKQILRYYNVATALKYLALASLAGAFVLGRVTGNSFVDYSLPFYILVIVYYVYTRKFRSNIRSYQLDDCEPEKFLPVMRAFVCMGKRKKSRAQNFYNLINSLLLLGEDEKAEKCLELMDVYCDEKLALPLKHILKMDLYLYRKDFESIASLYLEMQKMVFDKKVPQYLEMSYNMRISYFECTSLYLQKQYEGLLNLLENLKEDPRHHLGFVRVNYYKYVIATLLGDDEKAQQYRAYVLEHGGTTWYRKKCLESDDSKEVKKEQDNNEHI